MLDKYQWLVYVGLAGLSWGVYVPLIAYGGKELSGPGARLMAFLCVATSCGTDCAALVGGLTGGGGGGGGGGAGDGG